MTARTLKSNVLSAEQSHRLYAWIESRREYAQQATAQSIAVRAAAELGYGITESNVSSARRALHITRPKPAKPVVTGCRCRELAVLIADIYELSRLPVPKLARELAGEKDEPYTFKPPQQPPLPGAASETVERRTA